MSTFRKNIKNKGILQRDFKNFNMNKKECSEFEIAVI